MTDQVVPDKYVIDGAKPDKGFQQPKNFDEACGVVSAAYDARDIFVPVGGGTRLEIGYPLGKYDIALDMSYMNDVISYNPADLTCTVQSGITLSAATILSFLTIFIPRTPPAGRFRGVTSFAPNLID